MTETNLERIQRLVSSYDTKAGRRLRYHITRAQADKEYAEEIHFNLTFDEDEQCRDLADLFVFGKSREGKIYWYCIDKYLYDRRKKYEHTA